jgi:hypothetical protein
MIMIQSFIFGALLVLSSRELIADTRNVSEHPDAPLLVIWENPHDPSPGDSDFLGGLITVVWPDGRIIRAAGKKQVGCSYVEGHVQDREFKNFISFVMSPSILAAPNVFAVAVDAPSRTFVLHMGDKRHQWTRSDLREQPMLIDIETRIWSLQIKKVHRVSMQDANLKQFEPR